MNPLAFGGAGYRGANPEFNPTKVTLYESPDMGYDGSSSQEMTWTHGLGFLLRDIEVVMTCITTEYGWAVGDELYPGNHNYTSSSTAQYGYTVYADTTSVSLRTGAWGNPILTYRKDTGALVAVTAANWCLKIRGKRILVGDVPDIIRVPDVVLAEGVVFNVSELDVVLDIANYTAFTLHFPYTRQSADTDFLLRTSSDLGGSFDSGGSDYGRCQIQATTISTGQVADNADDSLVIMNNGGTAAGEDGAGQIHIANPGMAQFTIIYAQSQHENNAGNETYNAGGGRRKEAGIVNAIRIFPNTGNFEELHYRLVGHRGMA